MLQEPSQAAEIHLQFGMRTCTCCIWWFGSQQRFDCACQFSPQPTAGWVRMQAAASDVMLAML